MPQPGILQVDLHGANQRQARQRIEGALRQAGKSVYRIRLIHGHSRGSVLKEMIYSEYKDHPRVRELVQGGNEGVTELVLRPF